MDWNKVTRFAERAADDVATMLDASDFTEEERAEALRTLATLLADEICELED